MPIERGPYSYFYILAFILTLAGAILLLTSPFSYYSYSWYTGYSTAWYTGAIGVWSPIYGSIILFAALLLIICAVYELIAIVKPDGLPDKALD